MHKCHHAGTKTSKSVSERHGLMFEVTFVYRGEMSPAGLDHHRGLWNWKHIDYIRIE